ncbi:hypothetical protein V6N13_105071 [Hibiscus sabdariffa]
MKDWIKLCRSLEVDCNSVGSVMHCFDNCLDRMTKGMPRRRQRVLPGRVSWRVLDIFCLGGKFCCFGGKFCCLGGKFCTTLLKSAMAGNLLPTAWAGKSPTCGVNGKSPAWAGKSAILTESLLPAVSAENCLPAVSAESPAWAGKSALAGNMPDSAQLYRGRFTNSAPADVIVAALAGSECYQPGTASVQLPIWF